MGLQADFEFIDLFAGCGGGTSGAVEACQERGLSMDGVAINHNQRAIETHWANHRWMRHERQDIRAIQPLRVVPSGRRDFFIAAPECKAYSPARGNKPWKPQFRTSPREILRFMKDLDVPDGLIENVREFQDWGPNDENGDPIPAFEGIFFKRFIDAIRDLGYNVDWRVLNAADYGDATTRKRLFIQCRRGLPITWPKVTHTPDRYRSAREIIDWSIPGVSIFNRKNPLKPNTIKRIIAGLKKHGGDAFLAMFYGTNDVRSLDLPAPTITAQGQHFGLCEFLIGQHGGATPRSIEEPTPTICRSGAISFIQAKGFIIPTNHGEGDERAYDLGEPMRTITGVDAWGLVEPLIMEYYGNGNTHPVSHPLGTVTTHDRFALIVATPKGKFGVDILFRMLQPHELAAAMSFPKDYIFSGTRRDQVQQIGNAWPVMLGKNLIGHMIDTRRILRRVA